MLAGIEPRVGYMNNLLVDVGLLLIRQEGPILIKARKVALM